MADHSGNEEIEGGHARGHMIGICSKSVQK